MPDVNDEMNGPEFYLHGMDFAFKELELASSAVFTTLLAIHIFSLYLTYSICGGTLSISFGSWNACNIGAKANILTDLNISVLGIQEVRIDERKAGAIAGVVKSQGYTLHTGALPIWKRKGTGKLHLQHGDCPGVGFLVHDSVPSKPIDFVPVLQPWYDYARIIGIEVFIGTNWITCWCIYAPVDHKLRTAFLEDIFTATDEAPPHIILGDFNMPIQDSQEENFFDVRGYLSMMSQQDAEVSTYRHGDYTSRIDDVFLRQDIAYKFLPLHVKYISENGHAVLRTNTNDHPNTEKFFVIDGTPISHLR